MQNSKNLSDWLSLSDDFEKTANAFNELGSYENSRKLYEESNKKYGECERKYYKLKRIVDNKNKFIKNLPKIIMTTIAWALAAVVSVLLFVTLWQEGSMFSGFWQILLSIVTIASPIYTLFILRVPGGVIALFCISYFFIMFVFMALWWDSRVSNAIVVVALTSYVFSIVHQLMKKYS